MREAIYRVTAYLPRNVILGLRTRLVAKRGGITRKVDWINLGTGFTFNFAC